MRLGRLIGALLAAGCCGSGVAASVDTCRDTDALVFDVTLDGERIGAHSIHFQREAGRLVMQAMTAISVKRLLFTVYQRDYRSREEWRGDELQSVDTSLEENGTRSRQVVARTADGSVTGLNGTSDVAFPASYWSLATVRQSRLFDTTNGRVLAVEVRDAGPETVATASGPVLGRRFAVSGELNLELWYDRTGCWLKMRYRPEDGDRRVEFTRR